MTEFDKLPKHCALRNVFRVGAAREFNDLRYGIAQDEHKADKGSMSENTNLFRLVGT